MDGRVSFRSVDNIVDLGHLAALHRLTTLG
jgi:hypothetical protein